MFQNPLFRVENFLVGLAPCGIYECVLSSTILSENLINIFFVSQLDFFSKTVGNFWGCSHLLLRSHETSIDGCSDSEEGPCFHSIFQISLQMSVADGDLSEFDDDPTVSDAPEGKGSILIANVTTGQSRENKRMQIEIEVCSSL